MNTNFWKHLPKPFFALAPMSDVTDAPFRRIIAKCGKPDVMFTEFVSADGLFLGDESARQILMKDLLYSKAERPIVAQFFTAKPEIMKKAAQLAVELGFDGIDINMGCPDRGIEKQGAGAALIKNPKLATELIKAAKEGAGSIPVSVKTRIGYNKNELEEWLPILLKTELATIIIHARTRKEMSKTTAHFDQIKRAVEIKNNIGSNTLIVGNGGVVNLEDARQKAKETGADGVMLGKAIFGNPSLFSNSQEFENRDAVDFTRRKLEILIEHTKLFEELLGEVKNFSVMKKHFKAYVAGFPKVKELRSALMETNNVNDVEKVVTDYLQDNIKKERL